MPTTFLRVPQIAFAKKDFIFRSASRGTRKTGFLTPPRVLYQRLKSMYETPKHEKKCAKTRKKSCRQTERPLRQEQRQYKNTTVVNEKNRRKSRQGGYLEAKKRVFDQKWHLVQKGQNQPFFWDPQKPCFFVFFRLFS